MISRKDDTVKISGLKSEMVAAMIISHQVFQKYHLDLIITAGTEEFYPDGKRIQRWWARTRYPSSSNQKNI